MRAAVLAPIPGSASSSGADAVLMLIGPLTADFWAARELARDCAPLAVCGCAATRNARAASVKTERTIQQSSLCERALARPRNVRRGQAPLCLRLAFQSRDATRQIVDPILRIEDRRRMWL